MMLMTDTNSLVAPYHNRMPAILDQEDINHWLQPDMRDTHVLKSMLRPMDNLRMVSNLLVSPKEKFETNRDISVLI
jgi:putative SOS response-associated peptidase YedK